jgi:hypothetical protein
MASCAPIVNIVNRRKLSYRLLAELLLQPWFKPSTSLALGKRLDSLLNSARVMTLTCWDWRSVASSQRLTPASGPPGRLYSDRTFVSIRNPLMQDQPGADSPWIAPDRDRLRQTEKRGVGRKDCRTAFQLAAPPQRPAGPLLSRRVPGGNRPARHPAHEHAPSGLILLLVLG